MTKTRKKNISGKKKTKPCKKTKSVKDKIKSLSFYKTPPKLINVNGYNLLFLPVKTDITLIECFLLGGSYLEIKQNTGISHLLEHVLFSAWKKCKLNDCGAYWEKYGTSSNASTGITTNGYWIKGLTEFFDKMLEYIVKIILNPKFDKSLIEREKKAVENELNQYLNVPSWKLQDVLCKNLYTVEGMRYNSDYKKQLTVLKTLTKNKLLKYFHDSYTRKNILFIIGTNLEKKSVINKFNLLTKNVKKKNETGNFIMQKTICTTDEKKTIFIKEVNAKNTNIQMCFPLSLYIDDKDYMYLDIVSSIVAGDLSSLLVQILRQKLNLVYGVGCQINTNICGTVSCIKVSTLDKNVKKVVKNIFEICGTFSNKLITSKKLLRSKRMYKVNLYQKNLNNVSSIKKFYTEQFLYQLNNKPIKVVSLKEKNKKIDNLSKERVRSIIKRLFNPKKCLIVYQGKTKIF
jgi:predicted Zn-dependent peptidase